MDFLVLHKATAETPWADAKVVGAITKKAEEGDVAIEEALTQGEGVYVAVPLSKAVEREARQTMTLSDVGEAEPG